MKLIPLLLALAVVVFAQVTQAHEVRPAYLEIRQIAPETYEVLFKVPALGEQYRLGLYLSLPEGVEDAVPPRAVFEAGAHIERRTITLPGGLTGKQIGIDGLSATLTDVLARVEDLGGTAQTERLTPTRTSFTIEAAPSIGKLALTYLWLGVEHILGGIDHLLFVLALVVLVGDWKRVALTVTAFTVAHSITLAAATLGFVHVPGPPVEAAIALSIVFVAAEIVNARRGQVSLTVRMPWLVAFTFGLLHGFGFAGALAEVGLPQHAIPVALLFFNLGVEVGQLAFVATILLTAWTLRWAARQILQPAQARVASARLSTAVAYGIGATAAYWLIGRTALLLS